MCVSKEKIWETKIMFLKNKRKTKEVTIVNCSVAVDLVSELKQHTAMCKLKRSGKLYPRHFKVTNDLLEVKQTDSKKVKWLRSLFCMNVNTLEGSY